MYLVACQHYCLYTYLIIPEYKYVFVNFYKNYCEYCRRKNRIEYHKKNGVIEIYDTTHDLIDSAFSLKNLI